MALLTITVQRPGDRQPTTWLFDDVFQARNARELASQEKILISNGEDYITDFREFAAWVRREG
ncbi:hypothetical protein [Pseudoxanthomonas daejeonensis]|uniref:hypothetical protein n=1 Tax=Pseudoxanthomonas daejeonensis TaxID=266062 RepID=UPI001391F77E|nr:hypothetical protein [Pseudoxanthomonas daejeonensis]